MNTKVERLTVVGAGLTGPLLAILLANRGFEVDLYDRRNPHEPGASALPRASVNLTLCCRGLEALERVGLSARVHEMAVPVHGRSFHDVGGRVRFQPYGNDGEALYSISRRDLSRLLLDAVAESPGVHLHFGEKCRYVDVGRGTLCFENVKSGVETNVQTQRILAADGASSIVRDALAASASLQLFSAIQQLWLSRFSRARNRRRTLGAA